jgi:hypothetical protein
MTDSVTAFLSCFVPLAVGSALFGLGLWIGSDTAEAEGLAALNALRAEYQEEKRQASDAYGKAVADALEQYRTEVSRGDVLAGQIAEADKAHAAESETLRRKIAHAAKNSDCTLAPDIVRMLNDAAGARVPDAALPGTIRSADPPGGAGAGQAPDLGLLEGVVSAPSAWACEGKPNADGGKKKQSEVVTQTDLLAWVTDYIARTRRLEDRLAGWRELFTKRAKQGAEGGK